MVWWAEWGTVALDLLWPRPSLSTAAVRRIIRPFCERCGEAFDGAIAISFECTNCGRRKWSLAWARATYRSEGIVREAIHRMKYEGEYSLLHPVSEWLIEGYDAHASLVLWDALVPVPLHPLRLRERGFNQAKELASRLGKKRTVPVWDCLRRLQHKASQAQLTRTARLRNLRQTFDLKKPFDVTGRALLIIDDVLTTGATADHCARVLRHYGAAYVACLTVARA